MEKKIEFCLSTPYGYNKTPKAGNFTNRDVVCLMVWKPPVLDGFSPEASREDLGRDIITKTGNHQVKDWQYKEGKNQGQFVLAT